MGLFTRMSVILTLMIANAIVAGYMGVLNILYATMGVEELATRLGTGLPWLFTFMDGTGFVVMGVIFILFACLSALMAWLAWRGSESSWVASIVVFSMNTIFAGAYLYLHTGITYAGHYLWWEEVNALLSLMVVIILLLPRTATSLRS